MTNKTINGVPRELLRQQFEEKNEHRGWFVAGGRLEDTSPEGYIYEDFTTDMCWTCYFEAASSALLAALQPTIAQLRIDLSNQTVLTEQANYHKAQRSQIIDEMTAEIAQLQAENEQLRGGLKLPKRADAMNGSHDYQSGWNMCLDEVRRMNDLPNSSK